MSAPAIRWPCPVCLGAKLIPVRVGTGADAVRLDHCERCGGVWFEYGEIQALRGRTPEGLWGAIARRDQVAAARCHDCHGVMPRDLERCAACGTPARFHCPACNERMEPVRHGDLTLDVCASCKGVWFDHHEVAGIWHLGGRRALERARAETSLGKGGEGAAILLDAMLFAPDLAFLGAHAAGHAAGAALEGLAHAPEAVLGAGEAVAETAASAFEIIVEIVAGIFG